jgi:hypothetical protein
MGWVQISDSSVRWVSPDDIALLYGGGPDNEKVAHDFFYVSTKDQSYPPKVPFSEIAQRYLSPWYSESPVAS